jgi:hypothetical protein
MTDENEDVATVGGAVTKNVLCEGSIGDPHGRTQPLPQRHHAATMANTTGTCPKERNDDAQS